MASTLLKQLSPRYLPLPVVSLNMRFLSTVATATLIATTAVAKSCNRDNCFRALIQYQSQTKPGFCNEYLATS